MAITPTAFTDPQVHGFDCFDLDIANEYAISYSERSQILADGAFTSWSEGDDAHKVGITSGTVYNWLEMQEWIEANCTSFVNIDGKTASGDWEGYSTIDNYASLSEFRSVAGLNASGFRRATSWNGIGAPTFSYGNIVAGDIFGYWILEDLAKAFSYLIHTKHVRTAGTSFDYQTINVVTSAAADCAAAKTAIAAATWPGWSSTSTGQFVYNAEASVYEESAGSWTGTKRRVQSKPKVPISPNFSSTLESETDAYIFIENPYPDASIGEAGCIYDDIDNLLVGESEFYMHEEIALSNGATRTCTTWMSGDSTDPYTAASPDCDERHGAESVDFTFVCRWDVTYGNV